MSQLGRDLRIDSGLLGTRADIEALLRGDPDARLAQGWRAGLIGAAVRRLVEGRAAVADRSEHDAAAQDPIPPAGSCAAVDARRRSVRPP
jgi:hypothetical protein